MNAELHAAIQAAKTKIKSWEYEFKKRTGHWPSSKDVKKSSICECGHYLTSGFKEHHVPNSFV